MIYLYSGWRRLDRAINIFLETWKLPVRDNLILNFVDYCIRGLALSLQVGDAVLQVTNPIALKALFSFFKLKSSSAIKTSRKNFDSAVMII